MGRQTAANSAMCVRVFVSRAAAASLTFAQEDLSPVEVGAAAGLHNHAGAGADEAGHAASAHCGKGHAGERRVRCRAVGLSEASRCTRAPACLRRSAVGFFWFCDEADADDAAGTPLPDADAAAPLLAVCAVATRGAQVRGAWSV